MAYDGRCSKQILNRENLGLMLYTPSLILSTKYETMFVYLFAFQRKEIKHCFLQIGQLQLKGQVKLLLDMKRLCKSRSFYVSVQPLHKGRLVIPSKSVELMA